MPQEAIFIVFIQIKFLLSNFLFNQMEQGNHIFFYAGSDEKWKKEFSERVTALAKDPEILNANISIISYQMSMESTGMYGDYNKGIAGRFRFELLSPKNIAFKSAAAQQEMKDLHSDGNGAGWAMLCKRYKLKVRGNSTKMWNVLELEEFNQYK